MSNNIWWQAKTKDNSIAVMVIDGEICIGEPIDGDVVPDDNHDIIVGVTDEDVDELIQLLQEAKKHLRPPT